MIRCTLYDPASQTVERGDEQSLATLINQWQTHHEHILWIDMEGHDHEPQIKVLEDFSIHPLAIQDALRERHPPKIESFSEALFILLRGLDAHTQSIDFAVIQLALFVGERFFITRHDKPSTSVNALITAIDQNPTTMAPGAAAVALQLATELSRRYVQILLDLEPRLDAVEQEMFDHPNDAQLAELTHYKSKLRHLARIGRYHQHVVTALRNDASDFMPNTLHHELNDLNDKFERTQSLADLYYQTANDLTDSYLALASHKLNNVMQVLTIFTVLFVPLTFLAGIYGMNFDHMPELHAENGYFIVIGLMGILIVAQLIYFRRKRWM